MKKDIIILTIFLATSIMVNAQDKKETGIYFGAIAGTQYNNFNNHFLANVEPELYAFSIGAGSAWTKNNYVIGFEFLYSNGTKDNNAGALQYVGFRNTLSFGYNVTRSKTWKVEPNLGVALNNNQLIVENKNNPGFQNLINNQICGSIGLNIKTIGKNGLFTGVKVGYILPFSGETEWENNVAGTKTGLNDDVGAFYIQLNIGGLLKLNNKKSP